MIRSQPRNGLCLIDQNSEEVHNLQSPDEKLCSWRPSELCLIDQNSEKIHNLQSPYEEENISATIHENSVSLIRTLKRSITCISRCRKQIGATIHIGQEI